MEVNCAGCAGCCIDWRAIAPQGIDIDHERHGVFRPLDDVYNLVPLSSDEVRAFVRAGLGDVLVPRLFAAEPEASHVTIDGIDVAALGGGPAFFVGLRKPPKPVGPFGLAPAWLPTCVFLDPTTLQCRIYGADLYPSACRRYPGDNLALGVETECERVEAAYGGERLLDRAVEGGPLLSRGALGSRVFAHPDPDSLAGVVSRLAAGEATRADRAIFVGVAAGSHPGSLEVDEAHAQEAREAVLVADSWAGQAIGEWEARAGGEAADPSAAQAVEVARGAPETTGWDA
jgi:Fe-S-cluster containining protein